MLPMPKALLKQGHRDMLRISDARMSGTSYRRLRAARRARDASSAGRWRCCGPATSCELDLPNRAASTCWSTRPSSSVGAPPGWRRSRRYERGYGYMFQRHVGQADEGCDFDFLRTDSAAPADEPVIY